MTKPWFLYLLECKNGAIYTGITTDVEARFKAHKEGRGAKYTRANPPVRIIGQVQCMDRSDASKLEIKIKELSPTKKKWMVNYLAIHSNRPAVGTPAPGV